MQQHRELAAPPGGEESQRPHIILYSAGICTGGSGAKPQFCDQTAPECGRESQRPSVHLFHEILCVSY